MNEVSVLLFALILDVLLGEPPLRIHPVVLMGSVIEVMKRLLGKGRTSGIILTVAVAVPFTLPLLLINHIQGPLNVLISSLLLSAVISVRLLLTSAMEVGGFLNDDIEEARKKLSMLVSRDTSSLSGEQITSAAIETLTENITDSVTAPLFYFILLGLPGAFLYRVVNTLDAMVGYLDNENRDIGWFPAKLDDVLNYIPARITGFLMVPAALLLGMNWRGSLRILLRDARMTPSPNSGFTMAAAAGALSVQLEKPGVYVLGDPSDELNSGKLLEAVKLSSMTLIIFTASAAGLMLVIP
jgi:adenosylcobinamide-phosphate synthase